MPPQVAHEPDAPPGPVGGAVSWLGHSSVLVELDGMRLLTDPVLRDRIGPLVRIAPRIRPGDVGRVDCVLLSHLHADHADLPTLRAISRSGPIVAPAPGRDWLRQRGLQGLREMTVGDELRVGSVVVRALPAVHNGRRWPRGPAPPPLGFLIRGSSSVYFPGDTDLFPAMADLRGLVDLALLPVAGWGPSVPAGHLDPERAAAAVALIAPAVAVPIHWGTLALPWALRQRADRSRAPREFAELVHRYAPDVTVRLLDPGDRIEL